MNQRALRFEYDEKTDTLIVVMKRNPKNNCHYKETDSGFIRLSPDKSVSAVYIDGFLKKLRVEVVDRKRNVFKVCNM